MNYYLHWTLRWQAIGAHLLRLEGGWQVACLNTGWRPQVEALDEVERAFVHVDYETRDEPEHKVERNLLSGTRNLLRAHDSVRYQVRASSVTALCLLHLLRENYGVKTAGERSSVYP